MKIAAISLSNEGSRVAAKLAATWPACDVFLHAGVAELPQARRFDRLADLIARGFSLVPGFGLYRSPRRRRPGHRPLPPTQNGRSGGRGRGRGRALGREPAQRA